MLYHLHWFRLPGFAVGERCARAFVACTVRVVCDPTWQNVGISGTLPCLGGCVDDPRRGCVVPPRTSCISATCSEFHIWIPMLFNHWLHRTATGLAAEYTNPGKLTRLVKSWSLNSWAWITTVWIILYAKHWPEFGTHTCKATVGLVCMQYRGILC